MSVPATLQDVALKAGVHRSTVSLALRGSPRISKAVSARIHEIAREMGYRANPLVTALMCSRRSRKPAQGAVLAYVTAYDTRYGWRPPHHDRPDYFPGAARRAEELGFKLEDFWLTEPGMTPKRFAQILLNRGVSGLLIGRLPPGKSMIELPWEHCASVALGLTLKTPQLHHVTEDAYASAAEAMNRCRAAGRQRIGFVFSEPDDSPGIGDRYLGAYLREQLSFDEENRIPHCPYLPKPKFAEHFLKWMGKHRPDAVIATHAEPIMEVYKSKNLRFPAGVKLVTLVNDKLQHGFAGIHHDPAMLGALAVDLVVGMLHRAEMGLPTKAHHMLVSGQWVDGVEVAP